MDVEVGEVDPQLYELYYLSQKQVISTLFIFLNLVCKGKIYVCEYGHETGK